MSPPQRQPPATPSQRRRLAEAAARLLSEGLASSAEEAAELAARRLALDDPSCLPSPEDVQNALSERQRLFGQALPSIALAAWRTAAEAAMAALAEFTPRIVGAVWQGALTSRSEITLHVHCDRPENVEHWLAQQGIPGRRGQRRLWLDAQQPIAVPSWEFFAGDYPITLCVLPESALRRPPLDPADRRPMARGSLAGLRRLLSTEHDPIK